MRIEATTIAKQPRLRYEPGELSMVLPMGSNDESTKHPDTPSLGQPSLAPHTPSCPALSRLSQVTYRAGHRSL